MIGWLQRGSKGDVAGWQERGFTYQTRGCGRSNTWKRLTHSCGCWATARHLHLKLPCAGKRARACGHLFPGADDSTATVSVSRLGVQPGHGTNKKSEEDHRPGRASGGSERARGEHSSGRASARMVWMRDLVVTVVSDRCSVQGESAAAEVGRHDFWGSSIE